MLLSELETLFSLIPTCTFREDKFSIRHYKIEIKDALFIDGQHYDDILKRMVNTRFRVEGEGNTPNEALDNLCNDISGKTVVIRGDFFKIPECFIRDDLEYHKWNEEKRETQRTY